jgi:hypothetical protein
VSLWTRSSTVGLLLLLPSTALGQSAGRAEHMGPCLGPALTVNPQVSKSPSPERDVSMDGALPCLVALDEALTLFEGTT